MVQKPDCGLEFNLIVTETMSNIDTTLLQSAYKFNDQITELIVQTDDITLSGQ